MALLPGSLPAGILILALMLPGAAAAQQDRMTIWDIPLGADVEDIPADAVALIACGTNGGPPSTRLPSFAAFTTCAEEESGLREVHFVYDDEQEYVALARGNEAMASRAGTRVAGFQAIVSLLVNDDGLVRGHRIVSDPRAADLAERDTAVALGDFIIGLLGSGGWACVEATPMAGYNPADGRYLDRRCTKTDERAGWHATIIQHHYRKPGQTELNPFDAEAQPGYLESSTRFELEATSLEGAPREWAAEWEDSSHEQSEVLNCPGCDLTGANLKRFSLAGANLAGAVLRDANLHDADLTGADLSGADLTGANLNKARLPRANLSGAVLEGAMLFAADLSAANLTGANLSSALMGRSRLTRAVLVDARLDRADLWGASLPDANLTGSEIRGARIVEGNLARANLTGAVLDGSILAAALLNGAVLRGASAMGVDFYGAQLRGADLTNVNLSGSRLTSSVLTDAILDGVVFDNAIMPNGRPYSDE
ncbi:MAG: pentapeptide repeat-containing protein [Bauldia sp.]|nr:pentapeptide repeat-containing protein [Bauldia sp.]